MVEAGADEVPEDVLLEALDLAHAEIRKLCEAQEELREKAGKPKWLDPELTQELESSHGEEIRERIAGSTASARPARSSRSCSTSSRRRSRWTRPRRTSRGRCRSRSSLDDRCSRRRGSRRSKAPVREQFENDLRALTDAEQDSKELKSAKRQLLFERIIETVELPFPVGPGDGGRRGAGRQGHADEAVREACRRGDLQGPRPQEDRRREAPARTAAAPRRSARSSARSASARARTARRSSRAARRRSCRC